MSVQIGSTADAARAHQELYAYWRGARSQGRAPSRCDIHPAGFRRLLPNVSLLDFDSATGDFRVRLAGTGLRDLFGREITGKRLEEVYGEEGAAYWRGELNGLMQTLRPAAGCHSLAWRGGSRMTVLWIRLPLVDEDGGLAMILGYDAPVELAPSAAAA
ncbi:MAG: PAS domain-containing protein [Caulobacteraceae bacterium]